jgi:glutamyl-tRNA synthetase/nondiscriminating glutamyl-tRNA synthetase
LLPATDLARRFRLEDVGKNAGVFDEQKLAWVNRHYLKAADPRRIASLTAPYLAAAGWLGDPIQPPTLDFVESLVPMIVGSVDRLDQAPERVRFVFEYDSDRAVLTSHGSGEFDDAAARAVIDALAADLATAPRLLTRDAFRAAAQRVRERTGQKGRGLLHPIRIALTGEAEGPELDLAVPAIERGAELAAGGVVPMLGCRERAARFAAALGAARRSPSEP